MSQVIELKELLESKAFVKEGSGMDFKSPEAYIGPFIDTANHYTDNFKVQVVSPVENKNDDESINRAFPRLLLEAKMPTSFDVADSFATVGLMLALDTQRPTVKLYTGKRVHACTNLTIFNADNVFTAELTNLGAAFKKAFDYFQKVEKDNEEYFRIVTKLKERELDMEGINKLMGDLLLSTTKNKFIGTSAVMNASKELINSSSVYAIKEGKTTEWNILNAHTAYLSTKVDIAEQATKTMLFANLFDSVKEITRETGLQGRQN